MNTEARYAADHNEEGQEGQRLDNVTESAKAGSLELLWVIGLIGCIVAASMDNLRLAVIHVRLIEPAFLLTAARVQLHEERALSGSWPAHGVRLSGVVDEAGAPISPNVSHIGAAANGAVTFTLAESLVGQSAVLSFRSAVHPDNPLSPVVWICGEAAVPAGFVAAAANATTLDAALAPSPCRSRSHE